MAPATSSRKRKIAEVEADNSDSATGEERVLSHAAQRRLRKRQKTIGTGEPLSEEAVGSKVIGKTKTSATYSIWVGNLAFKTTPQALKAFFGEDSGICRVHMPTKMLHGSHAKSDATRGDNKGFAYVDFTTLEAKEAAIAKSEGNLDGRRLLIKDGRDFAGRPEKDGGLNTSLNALTGLTKTARKILSQQKNPASQTVFLGNLSFETTEDEIAALFGRTHPKQKKDSHNTDIGNDASPLVKVRMGTFEDSGKCKGFAFVDFTDTQKATYALVNPQNHSLNGRALVVEYASADAVRRGQIAKQTLDMNPKSRASRRPQKSERIAAKLARKGTLSAEQDSEGQENNPSIDTYVRKAAPRLKPGTSIPARGKTQRLKPGASLANAQREKVAIVESTGNKITFDT